VTNPLRRYLRVQALPQGRRARYGITYVAYRLGVKRLGILQLEVSHNVADGRSNLSRDRATDLAFVAGALDRTATHLPVASIAWS